MTKEMGEPMHGKHLVKPSQEGPEVVWRCTICGITEDFENTACISDEKPECRVCSRNLQYHGMGGCLRAWVEGGPNNCEDFNRSKHADEC